MVTVGITEGDVQGCGGNRLKRQSAVHLFPLKFVIILELALLVYDSSKELPLLVCGSSKHSPKGTWLLSFGAFFFCHPIVLTYGTFTCLLFKCIELVMDPSVHLSSGWEYLK